MTREEMFEQVCSMITEKLEINSKMPNGVKEIPNLTLETEIRSLNLDSLDLTELIIDIEDKYDTEIDETEIENVITINDLIDKAEEKLGQSTSPQEQIQNLKAKHGIDG